MRTLHGMCHLLAMRGDRKALFVPLQEVSLGERKLLIYMGLFQCRVFWNKNRTVFRIEVVFLFGESNVCLCGSAFFSR